MNILPFQSTAAEQLSSLFSEFYYDDNAPMETRTVRVPLYLSLKALTGGGKTLILAETIERIRERLPVEPIILWVSTGKVVVEQTLTNLDAAGKYHSFIGSYRVKPLLECSEDDIREQQGLILLATVATFNVRDGKNRRVYKTALDDADEVLWERLKRRLDEKDIKRPFIIVYDEGHNLSEQQSDLLFSLAPDALISATATPRVTAKLSRTLQRLAEHGWTHDKLTVAIHPKEVVDSGLVKTAVEVGGYQTPMEEAIDELLTDCAESTQLFDDLGIDVSPKAIYVCDTNLAEGGLGRVKDDEKQPFTMRKAPPILIWRYLTEDKGIDPASIAVYCDLKVDKHFPMPDEMVLFRGGDKDYQAFIAGGFKHIIFNLSLQEGWDDPDVYFAYIDKSMGSEIDIEQLVGRVLRQPGVTHYPNARLNTASFYVRIDNRNTFKEVISRVQSGLGETNGEVRLTSYDGREHKAKSTLQPRKRLMVPAVNIDAAEAFAEVARVLADVHDFRSGDDNTRGSGARAKVLHHVGLNGSREYEWKETDAANKIMARALFVREMQSRYGRVYNLTGVEDPKFDALVESGSRAAKHLLEKAAETVRVYLDNARLHQTNLKAYVVGPIQVDPAKTVTFNYSVHEGYSGLNKLEIAFAQALDKKKLPWARNPSRSGFGIPLLQEGSSQYFYPDFLVWDKRDVFAIDPKGGHLLNPATKRKLLTVQPDVTGPRLHIRLLCETKIADDFRFISKGGYTVFAMRDGNPHALHIQTLEEAVDACLRKF